MSQVIRVARFNLVVLAAFALVVAFASCNLKKDKDKDKTSGVPPSAEDTAAAQLKAESERAALAQKDLDSRVSYYKAISGTYVGTYSKTEGLSKRRGHIKVRLTPVNLPVDLNSVRPKKEGDVLAQLEQVSLTIDVSERAETIMTTSKSCRVTGVRPDFQKGTLSFSCTLENSVGSRNYVLGLGYALSTENPYAEDQTLRLETSSGVSSALLKNQIRTIDALDVEILSTETSTLSGRIYRLDTDQ